MLTHEIHEGINIYTSCSWGDGVFANFFSYILGLLYFGIIVGNKENKTKERRGA